MVRSSLPNFTLIGYVFVFTILDVFVLNFSFAVIPYGVYIYNCDRATNYYFSAQGRHFYLSPLAVYRVTIVTYYAYATKEDRHLQ